MGELIQAPDTQPLRIGLMNLIGLGGLGYYVMGQHRKAYLTWAVLGVFGFCTFGAVFFCAFITAYDAYLLAQKLNLGQSIGERENGLAFLDRVFR